MQISIDRLQIRQCHALAEDELVETRHEIGIQESPVEDGQTQHASDELEVTEMVGVDS